jgi:hypothetical protein
LSGERVSMCGFSVGSYAAFAGGRAGASGSNTTDIVEKYNTSLTKSSGDSLTTARYAAAVTVLNGNVIIAGGYSNIASAEVYDEYLNKDTTTALTGGRYNHAALTIGDYAIFAGGVYLNTAEAYSA